MALHFDPDAGRLIPHESSKSMAKSQLANERTKAYTLNYTRNCNENTKSLNRKIPFLRIVIIY